MPEKSIIAFLCPNCGAEVDALEGYTNVQCEFCGSRLLISRRIGVGRVFAKPLVKNPHQILKRVVGKDVEIVDLDLLFVPLIRVSAEIIGWIYGHKKGEAKKQYIHSAGGGDVDSAPIVVGERTVKKRIRRIQDIEIDPSEFYRFGIERIKIEDKKFYPYNDNILHRFGNVFDLPLSNDEYIEKGVNTLIDTITSQYKDWDEFKSYLRAIKRNATIYYYPVYFARIESDNIPYTYSIDAVTGDVLLKSKVVEKKSEKTLNMSLLYGGIGMGGIIVSLVAQFISRPAALLIALPLLFFTWRAQYGTG